jgi:hypothetical protein
MSEPTETTWRFHDPKRNVDYVVYLTREHIDLNGPTNKTVVATREMSGARMVDMDGNNIEHMWLFSPQIEIALQFFDKLCAPESQLRFEDLESYLNL